MKKSEIVGDEIFINMAASFPIAIKGEYVTWQNQALNWGNPI